MALDFGLCTLAHDLVLLFSMFRGRVPDRLEQQGREAHDDADSVTGGLVTLQDVEDFDHAMRRQEYFLRHE